MGILDGNSNMRWWPWNWPLIPDGPFLELAVAPEAPEPPLDIIARGETARRLLLDPTLRAALQEVEDTAIELWLATKPSEADRREELYRQVKAIELLRDRLRTYRDAGTVKRAQLEAEEKVA